MSQPTDRPAKSSPVLPPMAQVYTVGGAVRDALLGLASHDHDYVVVGTTPAAMLAAGFLAVGRDFPVFLHPQTHDEYALARTERKTAAGYHGFSFHAASDVTLEQDLARRDLTINAIAIKAYLEATRAYLTADKLTDLIDPFDGQGDLQRRVLRHVSAAFAEDPVRILRLARFAARYTSFSVAPETMALASRMVTAGEVDALVPERVWQEFAKGLMEAEPARMFAVLHACGALQRLLPELLADYPNAMKALNYASACAQNLAARWATLQLPAAAHARLKVPSECRDLALSVAGRSALAPAPLDATGAMERLQRVDVLRKPERLDDLLCAQEAVLFASISDAHTAAAAAAASSIDAALNRMRCAARAAIGVDAGVVAQHVSSQISPIHVGERIKAAVHSARLAAVASAFEQGGAINIRALSCTELEDAALLAALTELLHRAYARLAAQGFNYTAVDQSVQVTAERLQAAAVNFVALDAAQHVLGLISLSAAQPTDGCELYRDASGMHFGQFAVQPSAQGQGIGERLIAACADAARRHGAQWLALDTSEGALQLRRFYKRLGYADCGFVQHSGKVYRSVLMKKPLWAVDPAA